MNSFFPWIYVNFADGSGRRCLFSAPGLKKISDMESSVVFERNVVEFVTVAAEFCSFLEHVGQKQATEAGDVLLKLLPLLYLKASMLPEVESDDSVSLSQSVTEQDYDYVRESVAGLLGSCDDYLEVFTEDMKYSDVPVRRTISEDMADIYQPVRNFVESFKSGVNEVMTEAVACCRDSFASYWGQSLLNAMRAIHSWRYSQVDGYDEL